MQERNKQLALTNGNILGGILLFAFPILIGNVFQQLYNVVDTSIIGNVLGDDALAAVGATAALYNLIIGFANGITNGFSIVIARFFGAENADELHKATAISIVLTGVVSCLLTVAGLASLKTILLFLNTPQEIFAQAESYLRIIIAFSAITMFYNMFAGMLRAIGNSRAPLYFLIIATVFNIRLDIVFVRDLGMGVAGAAYATVIAQAISVVLCILYIVKKCPIFDMKRENFRLQPAMIKELFTMGLSMGLMLVVVSIGSVVLQSAVNILGPQVITAHTAARKIDDIFMLPLGTLSLAASTFASQNYGAGKMERVKKGIISAIVIAFVWSAISCIAVLSCGRMMIVLLSGSKDSVVINTAVKYITINIPFSLC